MGWRRRRGGGRGKSDKNVKYFIKEGDLHSRINTLMENRHRLLAPFPLVPEEVYRAFWSDEEWAAMELLKGRKILRHDNYFYIRRCPLHPTIRVIFSNRTPQPVGESELHFASLPQPMRDAIREWIPLWDQYRTDAAMLMKKLEEVAEVCTTYGNLLRLWPDIEGFITAEGKAKLKDKQVKSPYPREALDQLMGSDGFPIQKWKLKHEFSAEVMGSYSAMIAEALMLPEIEGHHMAYIES